LSEVMAGVTKGMTGKEKAAVLLMMLGPELSALVLKHLDDALIELLTKEIASKSKVASVVADSVLEEFSQLSIARDYLARGGPEFAREILERALGVQKALDILKRLAASSQPRPFDFARKTQPSQLLSVIQNEHPQTLALIMSYLDPAQAAQLLAFLAPETQAEVAARMALMDRASPDAVRDVEKMLERKLSSFVAQEYAQVGGIQSVVDVLNRVDRATEKSILESMERNDPQLAEEIKKRLFVFEDIVLLDDRSVQRVLREVDYDKELPLALKAASIEVKAKIFRNMSKRAAEMLQESIQFLGPVRLRDVEQAQQSIVNIIRRLEEEGEIVIARGGEDEVFI